MSLHIPVLAQEVLSWLDPQPNQDFIDATVGLGGHAALLLERTGPNGRLLAFDRDERNLAEAKQNLAAFGDRVVYVNDSYQALKQAAYDHGFSEVRGILMDLGFSSGHIEDAQRGFSFQRPGPLDMRYDQRGEVTAEMIVNSWTAQDLAHIFFVYGEERHAHKIAKAIVESRRRARITTTSELADLIVATIPRHGKIHPATRVFQALRIAVNDELAELEQTLPQTRDVLQAGGRLAVISFHSLEDRIVKRFLKAHADEDFNILTKRPVIATEEEQKQNPRSRSAKLRVAERLGGYVETNTKQKIRSLKRREL